MGKIVLIPAAGEGRRFRQAGLPIPKPLICARGQTLLEHTLACFSLTEDDHLILAVQRHHGVRQRLEAKLHSRYPDVTIHWFELERLLPGQLATTAAALEAVLQTSELDPSLPLLVHNCDTGFQWQPGLASIEGFASMAVFPAEGTHWSFGQPDPEDSQQAIAIAEKRRISDLASIGLYGFSTAQRFLKEAKAALLSDDTLQGEYYIAPMLQKALTKGMKVSLPRVDGVKIYGTPEELCQCFKLSLESLKSENGLLPASHPPDN